VDGSRGRRDRQPEDEDKLGGVQGERTMYVSSDPPLHREDTTPYKLHSIMFCQVCHLMFYVTVLTIWWHVVGSKGVVLGRGYKLEYDVDVIKDNWVPDID